MTITFTHALVLAAANPAPIFGNPMVFMVLMIAMMYLLLIRPQQKQRKELQARIDSIEKGDKVVTTGGLHATVHQISDKTVTLKPGGDNFFLTFDKASIASVNKLKNEKSSAKPEKNDSEEEKK